MSSFDAVAQNLRELLRQPQYEVVALTGRWGTGKTHLWRALADDFKKEAKRLDQKAPLYVSVFGASSIQDLKLRILEAAYLSGDTTTKSVKETINSIVSRGASYFGLSTSEMLLAWLPKLVANRLVVLDDLERIGSGVAVEEVLGLVDGCSEAHKTRFLLLLNSDELATSELMWRKLHEKVVDIQLTLQPTPDEVFSIAANRAQYKGPYPDEIRNAIGVLNVRNIRVVERVLRVVARFAQLASFDQVPPKRIVPSVVLLTVGHYRGMEHPVPLAFMKKSRYAMHLKAQRGEDVDPQEAEWASILDRLGIDSADEFEVIVQDFLEHGVVDQQRVDDLMQTYRAGGAAEAAVDAVRDLRRSYWWDSKATKSDLLAKARELRTHAPYMSVGLASSAVGLVEELGDHEAALQVLSEWEAATRFWPADRQLPDESDFAEVEGGIHPGVLRVYRGIQAKREPPLSISDATESVRVNSGWGERERATFSSATADDYVLALRAADRDSLRTILATHMDWMRGTSGHPGTSSTLEAFASACRRIRAEEPEGRLAWIVERAFQANGQGQSLIEPAARVTYEESAPGGVVAP